MKCYSNDSAVSHSIRNLERYLACRLFHKLGKKVTLTEAGEAFFLREDDEGNVTPITSREMSRQFAVEQVKQEMMKTMGLSDADATEAARQWVAEQDQEKK